MILYGASGHGKVIADILLASGIRDIHFWDDADKHDFKAYPVSKPVYTSAQKAEVIISIGDNNIRRMIAGKIKANVIFLSAKHPFTIISKTAAIGVGTVVMPAAIVNADTFIGQHCIINTAAVIEHDCILGDFVHISPNATLCGNVSVGEGTHVGAGAIILPGNKIGKWCKLGAGAVVIKDVPDFAIVAGNPAKTIGQNINKEL